MQNLSEDLDIIQKLDDLPNAVGGLSAAQLKAKFDEGTNKIKNWINTVLIPGLASTKSGESGASAVGVSPIVGLESYKNVQDALAGVMNAYVAGTVPDLGVTTQKIAAEAVTGPKIADGAVTRPKIADGAINNAKCDFSAGLTVAGDLTENGKIILSSNCYGDSLPQTAEAGRLFFLRVGS